MNALVVYSSRTGNTRTVAEAIHAALPAGTAVVSVHDAPEPRGYDLLALGFWVNRGGPDAAMLRYMTQVQAARVALFGTLGAYPDSPHAHKVREKAVAALAPGNQVLGTFLCHGRMDPARIAALQENPSVARHHPMTEERRLRLQAAQTHPDATDCAQAQAFIHEMLALLPALSPARLL